MLKKLALTNEERLGFSMLGVAAFGFGISPACAKLAYVSGAEPMTLVSARFIICLLFLLAVSRLRNIPLMLTPKMMIGAISVGCLLAWNASAYLSAVKFSPVTLAAALFYTFPVQVGLIAALSGIDSLNRRRLFSLVVAFCGVLLTIGFDASGADWRGIILAIGGGTGVALSSLLFAKIAQEANSVCLIFWATMIAGIVSFLVMITSFGIHLPNGSIGWIGFLVSMFGFSFALVMFYLALPLVGAVRAALMANLEPIVAIVFAMIVLHEQPRLLQLGGIFLILSAIFLAAANSRALPNHSGRHGS